MREKAMSVLLGGTISRASAQLERGGDLVYM
jgi:hypothetical protein